MVGDHPAICQINVFLKLYGDHLRIYLDDGADQPVPHSHAPIILVIAIHFDLIAHVIGFALVGSAGKVDIGQFDLLLRKKNSKKNNK
jgi:hypothetical protein